MVGFGWASASEAHVESDSESSEYGGYPSESSRSDGVEVETGEGIEDGTKDGPYVVDAEAEEDETDTSASESSCADTDDKPLRKV